jgi:hypothetical protein
MEYGLHPLDPHPDDERDLYRSAPQNVPQPVGRTWKDTAGDCIGAVIIFAFWYLAMCL